MAKNIVKGSNMMFFGDKRKRACRFTMKKILCSLAVVMCIFNIFTFSSCESEEERIARESAEAAARQERYMQARENYREAYENTEALEAYTVAANVAFKKGVMGLGMNLDGEISKANGTYTGNVVLKLPASKKEYAYYAPYADTETWTSLKRKNKRIVLPFNMADVGEGIICDLPDTIINRGYPSDSDINIIEFYDEIIDYFKEAAEDSLDLSDLAFSSGEIVVTLQNSLIKSFEVSLSGAAKAGTITCDFSCEMK